MGDTDFNRRPDQHGSRDVSDHGKGDEKPVSAEESERDAHSLPGTNQAGKGPGADDEHDRQTDRPAGSGANQDGKR